jgi:hypothetical protein
MTKDETESALDNLGGSWQRKWYRATVGGSDYTIKPKYSTDQRLTALSFVSRAISYDAVAFCNDKFGPLEWSRDNSARGSRNTKNGREEVLVYPLGFGRKINVNIRIASDPVPAQEKTPLGRPF